MLSRCTWRRTCGHTRGRCLSACSWAAAPRNIPPLGITSGAQAWAWGRRGQGHGPAEALRRHPGSAARRTLAAACVRPLHAHALPTSADPSLVHALPPPPGHAAKKSTTCSSLTITRPTGRWRPAACAARSACASLLKRALGTTKRRGPGACPARSPSCWAPGGRGEAAAACRLGHGWSAAQQQNVQPCQHTHVQRLRSFDSEAPDMPPTPRSYPCRPGF